MGNNDRTGPGNGRIILVALLVGVVTGAVAGVTSEWIGLPPVVLWVIIFAPSFSFVTMSLARRGAALPPPASSDPQTVLLEARQTRRRLVQTLLPTAGALLAAAGVSQWVRTDGLGAMTAASLVVLGAALVVIGVRTVISWDASYRGHAIRFENDPCFGERLLIDGQRVARGYLGLDVTMSAPIESGAAAGHRIVATSHAGLVTFSCRIVASGPASVGSGAGVP